MSLYNLHYLEFLATSHDKFWSHPRRRLIPDFRMRHRFISPNPLLRPCRAVAAIWGHWGY